MLPTDWMGIGNLTDFSDNFDQRKVEASVQNKNRTRASGFSDKQHIT